MKARTFTLAKLVLGVGVAALSCAALAAPPGTAEEDKARFSEAQQRFRSHVAFLADDLLEGRETGSRGFDIAAAYVAGQFAQIGLLPRGEQGYYQPVRLRSALLDQASPLFELIVDGKTQSFKFLEEFALSASLSEERSELTAPLVFAGYGVTAERFGYDDYAGLDVKGKIVVLLSGRPSSFPTEEGAHYANAETKRASALRNGAVGMITLTTPASEKRSPWRTNRQYRAVPRMTWLERDGSPGKDQSGMQNTASLSIPAAKRLFEGSGIDLDKVYADAEAGQPLPRRDLGRSVHMAKRSTQGEVRSANLVGMIEGSDPQLKNEFVVYSAHLDHIGINTEKKGDQIYNGAMDNAAGIATLIEAARLVAQLPLKPKRSMLFVAVTAEEKGLLGSDYFAQHPTVPAGAIVADVNLDMPLLTYDFADVVAFGAEHSSMKEHVAAAAQGMGLPLTPDPWPEQGSFTRSDHYSFVRQGIPSVKLVTGNTSYRKDEDPMKIWAEFRAKHYHNVSDDMSQPFNWDAAVRFVQVNYRIGTALANAADKPRWNAGDFFGDLFGKK